MWGLGVSASELRIVDKTVKVPAYFVLNATLSKEFSPFTVFLKAENLFNTFYVTEPGYPMKGRTIAAGLKFNLEPMKE